MMALRVLQTTCKCSNLFWTKQALQCTARLLVRSRHTSSCPPMTAQDNCLKQASCDQKLNLLTFHHHRLQCPTYLCSVGFSSSQSPEDYSGKPSRLSGADNLSRHGRSLSSADAMVNVGKLVPHKVLNLIDENGETLESVPSSRAVALSQLHDLKLVLVNQHAKPLPLYRLMTGHELHEEQVKLDEKKKSKVHPTTMKEVRLTAGIGSHDLEVKRKHIAEWLAKDPRIHIRVIVRKKGKQTATSEEMENMIHRLIENMDVPLVLNNPPKLTGKHQQGMSVVVRPMSAKERAKLNKEKNLEEKMKNVTPAEDS